MSSSDSSASGSSSFLASAAGAVRDKTGISHRQKKLIGLVFLDYFRFQFVIKSNQVKHGIRIIMVREYIWQEKNSIHKVVLLLVILILNQIWKCGRRSNFPSPKRRAYNEFIYLVYNKIQEENHYYFLKLNWIRTHHLNIRILVTRENTWPAIKPNNPHPLQAT